MNLLVLTACLVPTLGGVASSYSIYPSGQCVWYDKCGQDPDYPPSDAQHYLMCKYDGAAKSASKKQIEILQEVCPHLLPEVSAMQKLTEKLDIGLILGWILALSLLQSEPTGRYEKEF